MERPPLVAHVVTSDFERFANELAMVVWNRISEFPQFHHLQPQDYPVVFDTIQEALKPFQSGSDKPSRGGSP